MCCLRVSAKGSGDYGSLFHETKPISSMDPFLQNLQTMELTIYVMPVTRMIFHSIARQLPVVSKIGASAAPMAAAYEYHAQVNGLHGADLQSFIP